MTAGELAEECYSIITRDRTEVLDKVDRYLHGNFDDPYSAKNMEPEHQSLMRKAKQPWCAIPVKAANQALQVDGFRPGDVEGVAEALTEIPEWDFWQRCGLDAKQGIVHSAAIAYGHSFVSVANGPDGGAVAQILNPLNTTALYDDPVSDDNPVFVLTVIRPEKETPKGKRIAGRAVGWDRYNRYEFSMESGDFRHVSSVPHGGNGLCPVTRFVSDMDATGRAMGAVEPIIPWQDSFNQALFNMLLDQTFNAQRVLWATGVTPPYQKDADGNVMTDKQGNPLYAPFKINAGDIIGDMNPDAKFGQLSGSDQSGFVSTLDMLIKDFGALSQTPPDFFLGQMANLSAEALEASERTFRRRVDLYARNFGEAWERVIRIAMLLEGREPRNGWERNEVLWRDLDRRALSKVADGLAKIAVDLDVPKRALWSLIPGVSPTQLDQWYEMYQEEREDDLLNGALRSYNEYFADNGSSRSGGELDTVPPVGRGGAGESEL